MLLKENGYSEEGQKYRVHIKCMDESTKQIKVYPGGLKRGRNFALEPEWTDIQVGLYPGGPLFGILQYLLGQLTPKLCLKSVSFP